MVKAAPRQESSSTPLHGNGCILELADPSHVSLGQVPLIHTSDGNLGSILDPPYLLDIPPSLSQDNNSMIVMLRLLNRKDLKSS